jgi:hypothetical protein
MRLGCSGHGSRSDINLKRWWLEVCGLLVVGAVDKAVVRIGWVMQTKE